MKKIIRLSLIMLILVYCLIGTVYAALSCNANIVLSKKEISKNEEFKVDFNLSNVQADKGIISLGATLEYDKDCLELVKMEGKNGWDTPSAGSFNKDNGKMVLTRSSQGKSDETVLTITFKLKDTSKSEIPISLKDIVVADGDKPVEISVISKNIKVKNETQKPDDKPGNDDSNTNKSDGNNTNNNNSNNNNSNNNNSNSNNSNSNNNNSNNNVNTNTNSNNNNSNNNSNSANQNNTNNGNNNSNNNAPDNNLDNVNSDNNSLNNNSQNNVNSNNVININQNNNTSLNKNLTNSTSLNNNSNQINKDSTKTNSELPHTGDNREVLIMLIGVATISAIRAFFKIRMINKKK